jgi:hypothetical protein
MTIDITPEAVERFNRAWKPMDTAPRDGTWFVARTSFGYTRLVYFSDHFDRFPISDCSEVWSTAPVEWASLADVCHAIDALTEMTKVADAHKRNADDSYKKWVIANDALTASQAETAAAYEAAAHMVETHAVESGNFGKRVVPSPLAKEDQHHRSLAIAIRALTPDDSKAALDRMLADAEERGMRKVLDAASDYTQRVYGDDWKFLSNPIDRKRILAAIPKGMPHD